MQRRRRGPASAPCGSKPSCVTSSPSPSSQARSGLEVGRSPQRTTRSGRWRAGEGRAAQQRVVVRDRRRRRAARRSAGRRAAASRAARRRRRSPARPGSARPATTTGRCASRATTASARPAAAASSPGVERSSPRPPAAAAGLRVGAELGRAARAARAARSSGAPGRAGPRAPSRPRGRRARASSACARGVASCVPTSKNHFAARAVELDLVDRLAGADLAQLGRAVGGQHDERDARLVAPR